QDLVAYRDHGTGVAATATDLEIALVEVGALGAGRGAAALHERRTQPLRSLPGSARAPLTRGVTLTRAHPRPRGQVPRGRKATHVGADLSQDGLRRSPVHAGDRGEQLNLGGERADQLLNARVEVGDLRLFGLCVVH